MKSSVHLPQLLLVACLLSSCAPEWVAPQARTDVTIDRFYRELSPYGRWSNHSNYGRVWQPYGITRDWRPYTEGHWLHTARYGWYWHSNVPWGWAAFHYGRWVYDSFNGWLWVPGAVWAPAWVSWQYNDGYSAWAPLPPDVGWQPHVGLSFNYTTIDNIPAYAWVVVPQHYLLHQDIQHYALPIHESRSYLNTPYNRYSNLLLQQGQVVNIGVPVQQVERAVQHRVASIAEHETDTWLAQHSRGKPFGTGQGDFNRYSSTAERDTWHNQQEMPLSQPQYQSTDNQLHSSPWVQYPPVPVNPFEPGISNVSPTRENHFSQPPHGQPQAIDRESWPQPPHHSAMEYQQQIQQQAEQQRQLQLQQRQQQITEQQHQLELQQQIQQQAEQQRQLELQQQIQQQAEQQRQLELQQRQQQAAELQNQLELQQQLEAQQTIEKQKHLKAQEQVQPAVQ